MKRQASLGWPGIMHGFKKRQASLNRPGLINGFDQKPGLPESVWSNHVLHQTAGSYALPALNTGLKSNLAWLGLA